MKPRPACVVFLPLLYLLIVAIPSESIAGCEGSPLLLRLAEVPRLPWKLEQKLPHDQGAFTQGLLLWRGRLYESTGLYGLSSIREVDPASGRVLRLQLLPATIFGEGICLVGDRLFQLTWKAKTVFIYGLQTFAVLGRHRYETEGWGLAAKDGEIFMSDGSSLLFVRDPETFKVHRIITVHGRQGPIANLNELEFIQGALFANVWKEVVILRIKPETGEVDGYIDLGPLPLPDRFCAAEEEVANGIAYDSGADLLYVTGKRWPYVFVLKVNFHP